MSRASAVRLSTLALLWGSSFLWIKIGLTGLSPVQVVLGRVTLGAAVLLVLVGVQGWPLPRGGRVWAHLFVAAAFANAVPFLLFGIGEQTVDSAVAGVLNATTPLWTVLATLAVRTEPRLTGRRVAGLAVGFAGIVLIFQPWRVGGSVASWGGVACALAALCYGVSFVYMSRTLVGRGIAPAALSAGQLLAATVLMVMVTPFAGLQPVHLRWAVVVSVVVLGVFGTGLAYILNYRLLADEGAAATSTVTYLLPVVAVLLGFAVLGEPIRSNMIVGMVLVLGGVALAQRRAARTRPAPDRIDPLVQARSADPVA